MEFVEIKVNCTPEFGDILQAELAEAGFSSFLDNEKGFDGWAEVDAYEAEATKEVMARYAALTELSYEVVEVEKQNWNEEWEKNYEPIFIGDQVAIHADFHQLEKDFPYKIAINPKMSFGTGHHQTTRLMIQNMLNIDHQQKRVLDAGTGTGILAIMAQLLGAAEVESYDIDEWCVENSKENYALNKMEIPVYQGTIAEMNFEQPFDILIANINRNVLVHEMKDYVANMVAGGHLLLSGFYEEDIAIIEEVTAPLGLEKQSFIKEGDWVSVHFILK
ncbi:50S ribosomal protein L11 methyltransferase [Persicobacter diffluens]|uniref:Ribosomal protein L11 methyltransferase n=1 Tax=Persicobacter diffluens TaxID=981 RepID=A0AAN5AK08_9BACT|nr:ribosomal protein L11 methyltransferase [Persicobacter diffluens]